MVTASKHASSEVEAARRAGELQLRHAGDLHDRALRSEVPLEADDAAGLGDRLVGRANHVLLIVPGNVLHVFGQSTAGHRHAVAVQIAVVEQRLHQQRNAAGLEHVLGDVFAARLQVGDVGRALEDLGDVEQVELDAGLVRDRRQMQRAVGRAAGRRDDRRGILQRLAA